MRRALLLSLAACHAPSPAPPPVVKVDRAAAAPRLRSNPGPCALKDELAVMSQSHRAAELTATYPVFRCEGEHPKARLLDEVNARLAAATRTRFDDFLAALPLELPPSSVTLERHCRADMATPELLSVLCTDTVAGLLPEPRTHFEAHNLRLTGDRVQPFTVWNAVRDDARGSLLQLLAAALRDADASFYRDREGPAPATAVNVFTVTDRGLWFHYAEGQVGPAEDGTYLIELPWTKVQPLLSASYLWEPLRRAAKPPSCSEVGGVCASACEVGMTETDDGTCSEGLCCTLDTSRLPM